MIIYRSSPPPKILGQKAKSSHLGDSNEAPINLNLNPVIEVSDRAGQFYLELLRFIMKIVNSLSLSELFVI